MYSQEHSRVLLRTQFRTPRSYKIIKELKDNQWMKELKEYEQHPIYVPAEKGHMYKQTGWNFGK